MREEFKHAPFDVVLTTYSYFEGDGQATVTDRKWLRRFQWGLCVLDEGHALKKADSSRFMRLSQLDVSQRLLLTGTPVQNNLAELLTMLSFVLPSVFPLSLPAAFQEAERARVGGKRKEKEAAAPEVARARRMLAPFVLRRKKADVLTQLVQKVEIERILPMTPGQRDVYASKLTEARAQRERWNKGGERKQAKQNGKRPARSRAGDGGDELFTAAAAKSSASELFWNLRKAANHPCLLRQHFSEAHLARIAKAAQAQGYFGEAASLKQVVAEVGTYSDAQLHAVSNELRGLADLALDMSVLLDSAKFDELKTLLPKLKAAGSRVLIFSQHLEMLNLLEILLGPAGLRLRFLRLDGGTAVEERQQMIDQFQAADSKIFAFLLSTRAGGQGINLTAADTVIIHDLDWNPQLDKQAEDRAHRLGQKRQVTVYRLVTAGSVEESILQMQRRKTVLGNSVLGDEGTGDDSARSATSRQKVAAAQHDNDDEVVETKMDVAMMSSIIESALGLFAPK